MAHLKPALVALTLLVPGMAAAAECSDWNTESFFDTATADETRKCLDAGADLEARDENGGAPLHWAAYSGETLAVVQVLLDAGADLEAQNEDGLTPLHATAAGSETPAVVLALLDAGADIETRDGDGRTPLHWGVANSETPAVVQILLDAGADPAAHTQYGQTPFDLIPEDSPLKGTKVYWLLNEVRFR